MEPDRRDPLQPPESPSPPRSRAEAERRLAGANQHIDRLKAEIAAYKYKYQQRERYCAPRQRAIYGWERERGICKDFLRAQPAPAATDSPAAPPPPLAPAPLPHPTEAAIDRVCAELELQVTAARHRNPRLSSVSFSLDTIRGLLALLEPLRAHDGNVSPLRQRTG